MSDKAGKTENKAKKPSLYIRTFGCQMNVRDAELVYGLLCGEGFVKAESLEDADVVLFNTCSVRKHAEDRVYGKVGMLKGWKRANRGKIIGIIGCMAQSHKYKIFEHLPYVDFICGPANIYDIPALIDKVRLRKVRIAALDKRQRPDLEQPAIRGSSVSAYVSISEGCDNFCSYCIVPYARGRYRDRSKKLILDEVKRLSDSGYKEVILLGQNVNSYTGGFHKLLEDLNKIKGIERIRFITSHPKDASIDLFKAMRELEKVCEHLHLPLQSGSDKILRRMKRGYTVSKYLKLAEKYRDIVPKSSLTTDIIVGFPGETEKDFKDTCNMMKKVKYDSAFIFKYSPRPPAKSSEYIDSVPKDAKEERNHVLLKLQEDISRRINEGLRGKTVEVLVDSENEKGRKKSLCGRTRTNKIAVFDGKSGLLNKLINVKIKTATPNTLIGEKV